MFTRASTMNGGGYTESGTIYFRNMKLCIIGHVIHTSRQLSEGLTLSLQLS